MAKKINGYLLSFVRNGFGRGIRGTGFGRILEVIASKDEKR